MLQNEAIGPNQGPNRQEIDKLRRHMAELRGQREQVEALLRPSDPAPKEASEARGAVMRHLTALHGALTRADELLAEVAPHADADGLDRALSAFAHEHRGRLSAVLGWTQLLADPQLPHERRVRGLEVVERNTVAQVRLLDRLAELLQVRRNTLSIERAPVDVGRVVERALDTVADEARRARVTLRGEVDAGCSVRGDLHRLHDVVAELLANAVRATPAGGEVSLTARRAGDVVTVAVEDRGRGLSASALARLFEEFAADASGEGGRMGVGLYVARHVVRLHGGDVVATSEGEQRGSRFLVTLPAEEGA
ncbi:MAG: HAMP domain-containing sensor histidine kinase [Polyangiaceae bacterium]